MRGAAKGLCSDESEDFDGANNSTQHVPFPRRVPDAILNTSFIFLC